MVRTKVKCQYIENDSARRATFVKRSKVVTKKAEELSILGDVDTCAIVYGPYSSQPQVWPSPTEANRVIERYKSMPEYNRSIHLKDQERLTKDRIKKLEEHLAKVSRANRHKNLTRSMYACLRGEGASNPISVDDLQDMVGLVEENKDKIRTWKEAQMREGPSRDAEMVFASQGERSPQGLEPENEMAKGNSDEEVEMIYGMWEGTFPNGVELLSDMMEKNLTLARK